MNSQEFIIKKGDSVVIYDASLTEKKPFLKDKRRIGYLLLNLSLTALLFFLTPILFGELSYWYHQATTPQFSSIQESEHHLGFGELAFFENRGVWSPADWDFSLIIPSLKLNTKVIPSINPANAQEYEEALKFGVAHAQGTSFPNQEGTVYIFGHSTDYPWNITDYNALFYSLKYLSEGDEVILIYNHGQYSYQVTEKKVAEAQELEYLSSEENQSRLILQTCWPPGTSLKRLIIVAEPLKQT